MATYATGVLPGHEGLIGRADGLCKRAHVPTDLAGRRGEPELGQRMARKGGAA